MPYLVVCPECSARLKSPQPVPAGRTITCPQCRHQFTLSDPAQEVDVPAGGQPASGAVLAPAAEAPAAARSAPPSRPASREPAPRNAPASGFDFTPATRGRRREADDDDRPSARGGARDDDDDRPRSRRRDEDDDRPSTRKRRDADEDDRPRSRRRDDEEDDRPRARRGRDDDDEDDRREDDEEDRPRGRRPRKKKGKALLLALLIGGPLLLLLVVGVLLAVFVFDLNPFGGGGPSSEMLAWAPSDSQAIAHVNVNEARQADGFNAGAAGAGDPAKLGLRADDVAAIMIASRNAPGMFGLMGGGGDVTVFKLNGPADRTRIINSVGGRENTSGNKKYYQTATGGALHFASDRLVVVTQNQSTMTTLLQKEEGKVVISDNLRAAVKRADGTVGVACVGSAAEAADTMGQRSGAAIGAPVIGPGGPVASKKVKSVVLSAKLSGDHMTVKLSAAYDSSTTAQSVAEWARRDLENDRGRASELESYDVSRSGDTVTVTLRGFTKRGKNTMPLGGFGF